MAVLLSMRFSSADGVARHGALERIEHPEGDGQGGDRQHGPGHPPDDREVLAHLLPSGGGALGQHGEDEQGQGGTGGVEDGDKEGRGIHPVVAGGGRYGGQDRTGAGHEDQAQAESEDEPTARVGVARRPESVEGPLDQLTDLRDHEAHGQGEQQPDPEPHEEILGQAERAEHGAADEHGQTEADHQPGDDQVGAGPAGSGRSARDHHRQDGHDAGREAGDEASEEGDDEQLTHAGRSSSDGACALWLLRVACSRLPCCVMGSGSQPTAVRCPVEGKLAGASAEGASPRVRRGGAPGQQTVPP